MHGAMTGQYLHPSLDTNLSGFATTVGGEIASHTSLSRGVCNGVDFDSLAKKLLTVVPTTQRLSTLSGGEKVRLITACTIALRPPRLALDLTLEQLDRSGRRLLVNEVLVPLAKEIDVHVADNSSSDIAASFDRTLGFAKQSDAPKLAESLKAYASMVGAQRVSVPTLGFKDLSFRYPRSARHVFENTTFRFNPGVPYLLKAPNGSGKTTLARLLLGLYRPTAGAITVDETPCSLWKTTQNALFYAFQNPMGQLFGATVLDYLTAVDLASRRRSTFLQKHTPTSPVSALEAFGLGAFRNHELFDLPFAVQKWLTLAASMLSHSPWLFFDEPALGADRESRASLRLFFDALCGAGFGVVIVTHNEDFDALHGAVSVTIRESQVMVEGT
jgi:energy-coupling factor transport system ATP-binding protein